MLTCPSAQILEQLVTALSTVFGKAWSCSYRVKRPTNHTAIGCVHCRAFALSAENGAPTTHYS
eukprot:1737622-Alexandrium_andersonii.AAC.1